MYFMKLKKTLVNVCAGLALLTAGAAFGQTPAAPPAFEVASVKPAPPPADPDELRVQIGGDPGMIDYENVSLKMMIARAYEMKEFQISGPDWLETARFDILAKVPPNAPKGQTPLMLQNLLAERFKLKVHREQKVMPVYAMVVAKGGLKVKPLEGEPEGRMSLMMRPKGRQMSGPDDAGRPVGRAVPHDGSPGGGSDRDPGNLPGGPGVGTRRERRRRHDGEDARHGGARRRGWRSARRGGGSERAISVRRPAG